MTFSWYRPAHTLVQAERSRPLLSSISLKICSGLLAKCSNEKVSNSPRYYVRAKLSKNTPFFPYKSAAEMLAEIISLGKYAVDVNLSYVIPSLQIRETRKRIARSR